MRTAARRIAAAVCLALCLGAGDGVRPARAYRFVTGHPDMGPFLYGAGEEWKPRWDPAAWGPGMTMTVAVPDDPLWVEEFGAFHSMDDVRALVTDSLARWSEIGTADVRWRLGAVSEVGDSLVSVRLFEGGAIGRTRYFMDVGSEGHQEVQKCLVRIFFPGAAEYSYVKMRRLVTHELGHCLGLAHPMSYPNVDLLLLNRAEWTSMWGATGVMSVNRLAGGGINDPDLDPSLVSFTERIGASLLRPAPGWLGQTGAVFGTVLGAFPGAERVRTVVVAARVEPDGRPRNAVTRLTNDWGQFLIEGLDAGDYVLMVVPAERPDWLRDDIVQDTVRLDPVRIRAGERTGPLILTARRAEETYR